MELVSSVLHTRFQVMWVFVFFSVQVSRSPTSTNHIYIPNLCYIGKSRNDEASTKSDFPMFSYGYGKCVFVDFLIEYACPPNCAH